MVIKADGLAAGKGVVIPENREDAINTLKEMMNKKPEEVIKHAVKGMLPKNTLGKNILKKLHVYAGAEHNHEAQKPEALEIRY